MNPYTQSSLPASNREIMYSYNKLMSLAKSHNEDMNLDTSNFTGENPKINLIRPMELIRIQLKDILRQHTDKHKVLNDYTIKAINDFTDVTDVIDPDGLYKELYKLAQKWESEEGYKDAVLTIRTNIKDVLFEHKFQNPGRKNLTGKYEEDVVENSKSDSRMLKAVQGNIELMEAMLVLQNLKFASDANLNI